MCGRGRSPLYEGPERTLQKAVKVKGGLCWRYQDMEELELPDVYQGGLQTGSGTRLRERSMAVNKLERSTLTPVTSQTYRI